MDFGLNDARELIANPVLWPKVRDWLAAGGEFKPFPKGAKARLCLTDSATQKAVALWLDALTKADGWKSVVAGDKVRALKEAYPGVYPEVFRYTAYFAKYRPIDPDSEAVIMLLLKLRFPEVYRLCSS